MTPPTTRPTTDTTADQPRHRSRCSSQCRDCRQLGKQLVSAALGVKLSLDLDEPAHAAREVALAWAVLNELEQARHQHQHQLPQRREG